MTLKKSAGIGGENYCMPAVWDFLGIIEGYDLNPIPVSKAVDLSSTLPFGQQFQDKFNSASLVNLCKI